jgi:SnoaL-like domain
VISGGIVTVLDVIGLYYDAWANKKGDLSGVPLAPGFRFRGPVADFDDAEGYRAMAAQAGSLVSRFVVRQQFVDDNRVCSIIDWEMDLPVPPMTSAEILEVEDGQIVRGELIYDAQELRAAMAGG